MVKTFTKNGIEMSPLKAERELILSQVGMSAALVSDMKTIVGLPVKYIPTLPGKITEVSGRFYLVEIIGETGYILIRPII